MLQKELAKRLRGRFETEMDGDGWLAVSSDGMPLCRVKYNGNCKKPEIKRILALYFDASMQGEAKNALPHSHRRLQNLRQKGSHPVLPQSVR